MRVDIECALGWVDETERKTELGRVRELRTYPTTHALLVESMDGASAWEVPLVEGVVLSVDVEAALVTLRTMEGVERA